MIGYGFNKLNSRCTYRRTARKEKREKGEKPSKGDKIPTGLLFASGNSPRWRLEMGYAALARLWLFESTKSRCARCSGGGLEEKK